jgi:hypothetical protein
MVGLCLMHKSCNKKLPGNVQNDVCLLQLVKHLVTRQEIVPATMRNETEIMFRYCPPHTMDMLSCSKKCGGTCAGCYKIALKVHELEATKVY